MPFVQFGVNRKCQHLRIIDQVIHLYADHLFHLFNFSGGSKTIPSFIGTGFQSACWCRINPRRPSLANRRQTTRTSLTSLSYFLAIFIILRWYLHHNPSSSDFDIFIVLRHHLHHNRCTDFGLLCTKQICDGKSSTKSWITILLLQDSAQKGSMCVRCLATIPRFNPFSEWLCACSVSKCANVNRNDCENIFGKKWVSMWVTGTCRTEFGMQRNFFSPSAWRGGG